MGEEMEKNQQLEEDQEFRLVSPPDPNGELFVKAVLEDMDDAPA